MTGRTIAREIEKGRREPERVENGTESQRQRERHEDSQREEKERQRGRRRQKGREREPERNGKIGQAKRGIDRHLYCCSRPLETDRETERGRER